MKSTKKSLIASALSLVLCVSMLLGTTYAWFTDSVTSGKNKIIAGNLDVELTHTNAKVTNQKVQDATDLFGVALWEPGVIAWENFTVTNVGNLALKYALNLNVFDKNATTENHDLTEVIKVAVIDGGFTATGNPVDDRASAQAITTYESLKDFQKTGNLAGGNSTGDTFGVVLYWQPTDNDNLYNLKNGLASTDGQPLFIEFGVNLVATQDTVEADSFDKNYDKMAELPVIATFPTISESDLTGSKTVKVEEQGAVKSAEVKAADTKTVFDELKTATGGTDAADINNLTLTLNVDKITENTKTTETAEEIKTEYTTDLDISMEGKMVTIKGADGTKVIKSEDIKKLDGFVTIKLAFADDGYTDVLVKHSGKNMQKLASADATPTDEVNGGFYFDKANNVIILKTKTFSPFEIISTKVITWVPITESITIKESGYYYLAKDMTNTQIIIDNRIRVDIDLNTYISSGVFADKMDVVIDLRGHSIDNTNVSQQSGGFHGISVSPYSDKETNLNVTLMDSIGGGWIKAQKNTANSFAIKATGGNLTIEGGKYIAGDHTTTPGVAVQKGGFCNLVVNDGYFDANGAVAMTLVATMVDDAEITEGIFVVGTPAEINGGTFNGMCTSGTYENRDEDYNYYNVKTSYDINGGVFSFDPRVQRDDTITGFYSTVNPTSTVKENTPETGWFTVTAAK